MAHNLAYAVHTQSQLPTAHQAQMAEYLIVDTDAKASIDVKPAEQPLHADKHQVQVVHSWRLDNPVHTTSHVLHTNKIEVPLEGRKECLSHTW